MGKKGKALKGFIRPLRALKCLIIPPRAIRLLRAL